MEKRLSTFWKPQHFGWHIGSLLTRRVCPFYLQPFLQVHSFHQPHLVVREKCYFSTKANTINRLATRYFSSFFLPFRDSNSDALSSSWLLTSMHQLMFLLNTSSPWLRGSSNNKNVYHMRTCNFSSSYSDKDEVSSSTHKRNATKA